MKVRAHDQDGDFRFGQSGVYLENVPAAVAQVVGTRLALWQGTWFLDTEEGTPYLAQVLGSGHHQESDLVIQQRILDTQGVAGIVSYESSKNADRNMLVSARISTQFSEDATINIQV